MAMRSSRLVWDTGELTDPDIGTVADLARLHVAARRPARRSSCGMPRTH